MAAGTSGDLKSDEEIARQLQLEVTYCENLLFISYSQL